MAYKDETVSFRFLALSEQHRDDLRKILPELISRPTRKRDGFFTGVFDLKPDTDYFWLKAFIAERGIAECDFGLFLSVSTSSDSEIVRLPQFAADIFHDVRGVIDFSFTVLSEE